MRRLLRLYYDLYYLQGEIRLALQRFKNMREMLHKDREDAQFMKRMYQRVGRY